MYYSACLARLHVLMYQGGSECKGCICAQKIQLSDFVYSLEKSIALLHPLADSEFVTSRAQQVIKYFATFPNGSPAVSKVTRRHLCVCVYVCAMCV